ncbi:bacterial Ig-like domain-containing protein [Enterococcus wangshanyuanii]|uniref:Cell wall anchor n=1 Tax=Enterococcus wangshanyuanii TaxID=2005703 RepID=A0ABQ1P6N6_9ENTE|nr:bacterial Ig-like domain-containing protein [Enterococcus wangshanyuanii]GGC90171.1 cell wall anchor [Enterococcus wangshanyuanii]
MKKRTLHLFMLALLFTQSIGPALPVLAVTTEQSEASAQNIQTDETTGSSGFDTLTEKNIEPPLEETMDSTSAIEPILPEVNSSTTTSTSESEQSEEIIKKNRAAEAPEAKQIEDEILTEMIVTDMDGNEYSQTETNRVLNTTPVTAKLSFVVADKDYAPGSVYTTTLPEGLGYSDVSGEVANVGAKWSVDAQSKTLSITFEQRVTDTQFNLELKSYVFSEQNPLVTVETPGQITNHYVFDLYENVSPISYEQSHNSYGIAGTVYYNLDRTLSGSQTLELSMIETPGAVFTNSSSEPLQVYSYDVTIDGTVLPETKQLLEKDKDYTVVADDLYQTSVTIADMDQQKAYAIAVTRDLALESVSDYSYSFYNQYPTTKLGSVSLRRTNAVNGGYEFTAKSTSAQKMVKEGSLGQLQGANFYAKEDYYVYIYSLPTRTKVGEQIILESKNGQAIGDYKISARTADYQTVAIDDFFDVRKEANRLVLTATKESVLRIDANPLKIPFDQKDIDLAVSTPAVAANKEIMLISDQYVQPLSIINPNNAETAWGNFDGNGAYMGDTTVGIQGSQSAPIENLQIKVDHPEYLQLRAPKEIFPYYKLDVDYTVTKISGGSVVKFTTPITRDLNFDLGFNYVPDSLAKNVAIPTDTIPVSLSADGLETVDTTVKTNRKMYSERTLQASKNQFLVNARNDSFDSLVVTTKVPVGADVVYAIYDVSNDQVESIYPQYWDRGQYSDHPLSKEDEAYPEISYDESNNAYTFDFGKTSKRYIIEYKYANGWIDTSTINVTGSTTEPLYNNQLLSATVSVKNEGTEILSATQTGHDTLKNVTKNEVKTKNIDDQTRKVKNPTFDITTKGTTNAAIDLNSISIDGVPSDAYTVEATSTGVQLIFSDYVLTKNITITFNTISKNAGQISTETIIKSDNLEQMAEARRTVATTPVVLKFSDGDAEGVVFLTKANFHTFKEAEPTENVPDVQFELTDNVTGNQSDFSTDENGIYTIDGIMSGDYTLRATNLPAGYTIDEEYLTGKTIKLLKEANQFDIPLKEQIDQTSVQVKDSTISVGTPWEPIDNFIEATDENGSPVDFEQIIVTGTVDTNKVGKYEVTYQNQGKEATAVISVVADQATLVVKDSTIYVGDSWQAVDNFVSATDAAGKDIPVQDVTTSGMVDTTKAGLYEVTYSAAGLTAIAKITVLADQTSVSAKDSTISVGTTWQAADNFLGATDRAGKAVSLDQITIKGTVDTTTPGAYEVTYQNGKKATTITVFVVANQTTLAVKDSTIYVGDSWQAADNFISATTAEGEQIPFQEIDVNGTVDTTKSGIYEVAYSSKTQTEIAKITVKEDLSSLVVKDSTLYVGDSWQASDNFVSATDKEGRAISFDKVNVTGTVDTKKKGETNVTYTTKSTPKTEPQKSRNTRSTTSGRTEDLLSATAKITVKEKAAVNQGKSSKNQTPASQKTYPKTGEALDQSLYLLGIGAIFLVIVMSITASKRKRPD